jgi:Zn-finger nucleic acid-binding protein
MTERQGIEIDYCPKCRGVWLDRGELDKIIERSTAELAAATRSSSEPRPAAVPVRAEYGHGGERPYRKSFWKELFD